MMGSFGGFTILRIYAILQQNIYAAILLSILNLGLIVGGMVWLFSQIATVVLPIQLYYFACNNTVSYPKNGDDHNAVVCEIVAFSICIFLYLIMVRECGFGLSLDRDGVLGDLFHPGKNVQIVQRIP
ncbi:hypothetical protein QCA50_015496 [Cerrena zonata]|uniref:Uncharacterized protein n=1 Tax=Cerrena zonata TaxID=2478898 RepID=A0AAW0FPA3_9APHY